MTRYDSLDYSQEKTIEAAKSATHIDDLIDIITEMDREIGEWKSAAECDSPKELASLIDELRKETDGG